MATRPRYTIGAKLFVLTLFVAFLFTTSALWSVVSAATLQEKKFDCDSISVVISRNGNAPLTMDVGTEVGLWIEVPPNKPSENIYFYNIATSKLAVISTPLIGGVKTIVLQTYRDIDFYNARKSQLNLRCRRG